MGSMSEEKVVEERRQLSERMEVLRAQLRATGATVLSPTAEWSALRKEMQVLARKLK
jgi:hypothetical protein